MPFENPTPGQPVKESKTSVLMGRLVSLWKYLSSGVWADTSHKWYIKPLRTLNLSIRSFFNSDIQTQACAMTFRTILALVPALALLLAIGRGFGLQNLLITELQRVFPAQESTLEEGLRFVDSYLQQSGEGLFVGIGLLFLLYTLINLISNTEDTFNLIWGIREGRTIWRKVTDYTAMLLILPVIFICAGGLNMLLTTAIQKILDISRLSFMSEAIIEIGSWLMICLFFATAYMLFPNTKVKFRYAFIAGVLAGSGYLVLQWLFLSGQLYVSRYNAIYGSFAFIPLLLVWMQFVWVLCLSGAVINYSSQNVYSFSFTASMSQIAPGYRRKLAMAMMAVISKRFKEGKEPLTETEIVSLYHIPPRIVSETIDRMIRAGLINRVEAREDKDAFAVAPAVSCEELTVGYFFHNFDGLGEKNFVPDFDNKFKAISSLVNDLETSFYKQYSDIPICNLAP